MTSFFFSIIAAILFLLPVQCAGFFESYVAAIQPPAVSQGIGGIDQYTVLMIHGTGNDTSTSIVDSSYAGADSPHDFTASGDAQIDTSVAGPWEEDTGSILFDGVGDFLTALDSDDWYFANDDFVIDFRIRFDSFPALAAMNMVGQRESVGRIWRLFLSDTADATEYSWRYFNTWSSVKTIEVNRDIASISTGTWYHIAFVRSGNNFSFYQEGARLIAAVADDSTTDNITAAFTIGEFNSAAYFAGRIKEIRISKGTDRGWTGDTIQVPAGPYTQ